LKYAAGNSRLIIDHVIGTLLLLGASKCANSIHDEKGRDNEANSRANDKGNVTQEEDLRCDGGKSGQNQKNETGDSEGFASSVVRLEIHKNWKEKKKKQL
jgi:hypothetical protein